MSKRTYSIPLPDGTVVQRHSSTTRVFTHAVVRRNRGEQRYFVNLASSYDKARREAAVQAERRDYIEIVPL